LWDVSGEFVASIFRIKESAEQKSRTFHAGFLLVLFIDPEDGSDMFLRSLG
jgi:hypothetical protein